MQVPVDRNRSVVDGIARGNRRRRAGHRSCCSEDFGPSASCLVVEMNNRPTVYRCEVRDVRFGTGVKIVEPVNLYGCDIDNDCFVGPFVEIQAGVNIGARTRVQSHCFVCELVEIGEDCFIGHGVMFINDTFKTGGPARGCKHLWRATRVGNHVSIGSNATILPVTICDYVVIGAGAVVTRDIDRVGIYVGNPARFLRSINGTALARQQAR